MLGGFRVAFFLGREATTGQLYVEAVGIFWVKGINSIGGGW
jgi:hypothetical protein